MHLPVNCRMTLPSYGKQNSELNMQQPTIRQYSNDCVIVRYIISCVIFFLFIYRKLSFSADFSTVSIVHVAATVGGHERNQKRKY